MIDYKNLTDNQIKFICKYHGYEVYKRHKKYQGYSIERCPICSRKRTILEVLNDSPKVYRRVCSNCGFLGYSSTTINGSKKAWCTAVKDCIACKGMNEVK